MNKEQKKRSWKLLETVLQTINLYSATYLVLIIWQMIVCYTSLLFFCAFFLVSKWNIDEERTSDGDDVCLC